MYGLEALKISSFWGKSPEIYMGAFPQQTQFHAHLEPDTKSLEIFPNIVVTYPYIDVPRFR
jgi:hypothetical protein